MSYKTLSDLEVELVPSSSFTTRIDAELKSRLERIARFEERSASYIANQAIRALVEDREYTHQLIQIGLEQIEAGRSISEREMDEWVEGWAEGENRPFPKASLTSNS